MDIYCKFCGEPWEHDELHDMPDYGARGDYKALPYKRAALRFKRLGCGAWEKGSARCRHAMVNPDQALVAEVSQDLSMDPGDWASDASNMLSPIGRALWEPKQ